MITSSSDKAVLLEGHQLTILCPRYRVAFLEKLDECLNHGPRVVRVQCVNRTIPIAGATEFLKLVEDDSPMLVPPKSRMMQEVFATEFLPGSTLFPESLLHFGLCGNARMIGAG